MPLFMYTFVIGRKTVNKDPNIFIYIYTNKKFVYVSKKHQILIIFESYVQSKLTSLPQYIN